VAKQAILPEISTCCAHRRVREKGHVRHMLQGSLPGTLQGTPPLVLGPLLGRLLVKDPLARQLMSWLGRQ